MQTIELPDWIVFPGDRWDTTTSDKVGIDPRRFQRFIDGIDAKGASIGGESHDGI